MVNTNHMNNAITLKQATGYTKVLSLLFPTSSTLLGVSHTSCSFDLDLTTAGDVYKSGKPFHGRFFVYVKGNGAGNTLIDLIYDSGQNLNIGNNTVYTPSADLIQFTTRYQILDASPSDRPVASYIVDVYLKNDARVMLGYNVYNFVKSGNVMLENNLLVQRDVVASVPTAAVPVTVNKYDIVNYRNVYEQITSADGFTSTGLIEKKDPIKKVVSYYGTIVLKAGYVIGGRLTYCPLFAAKLTGLSELFFPVVVFYGQYGTEVGMGTVRVTSSGSMSLHNYDKSSTYAITDINRVSLTGISYEYN